MITVVHLGDWYGGTAWVKGVISGSIYAAVPDVIRSYYPGHGFRWCWGCNKHEPPGEEIEGWISSRTWVHPVIDMTPSPSIIPAPEERGEERL